MLVVATGSLLVLCTFLGLLLAFNNSFVCITANIRVVTALKELLEFESLSFNNVVFFSIFGLMSL